MPQVTTIALKPGAEIWNGSALYPNAVLTQAFRIELDHDNKTARVLARVYGSQAEADAKTAPVAELVASFAQEEYADR